MALEERTGLRIEPAVQRAALRHRRLVDMLNAGYAIGNLTLRGRADRRRPEGLPDCLISEGSANSEVKGCFEADSAGIIESASSPIRAAP